MNYLGRPVFLFAPNWRDAITRKVTFNLRPEDIGFGIEYFTPTQSWTVNQWQFNVTIPDPATLAGFDAFTAALIGRLNGFWLPIPFDAAEIIAGVSTSAFKTAGENLSTFWNDRPDVYLLFTFADGSQAAAKIQGVVDNADGTETVTLTAPLAQAPDATTGFKKIHYVRLIDDVESGTFEAEGLMERAMAVLEVPNEYAAAQQGIRPIYLFHFWAQAPIALDWYLTSFAAPVVSAGKLYTNLPIDFSNLEDTSDGTANDLKITAKPDAASPLSLFLPVPLSGTLFFELIVIDYTAPDVQTKLFSGRVSTVEDNGTRLTATCENRLGYLKRKIPRFLKGQTCNNILFDQNTCRVGRAFFETTVNIVTINAVWPPTVVCTFAIAPNFEQFTTANFLANGLFEAGLKDKYEARSIIKSSWDAGAGQLTLTLNLPLVHTEVGGQAQIVAGCSHDVTGTGCLKFKNYPNFSGFVAIPQRNPTLKAINANQVSGGGK